MESRYTMSETPSLAKLQTLNLSDLKTRKGVQVVEEIGIQFKVLYREIDLVKLHASAWNGVFGGAADVYLGTDQLEQVVTQVVGFPKNTSDIREIVLGSFGSHFAGGGISMRFHCI